MGISGDLGCGEGQGRLAGGESRRAEKTSHKLVKGDPGWVTFCFPLAEACHGATAGEPHDGMESDGTGSGGMGLIPSHSIVSPSREMRCDLSPRLSTGL